MLDCTNGRYDAEVAIKIFFNHHNVFGKNEWSLIGHTKRARSRHKQNMSICEDICILQGSVMTENAIVIMICDIP